MEISINAQGFRLDDELGEEIRKELDWLMDDYQGINNIRLELSKLDDDYRAHLRVTGRRLDIESESIATSPDFAYSQAFETTQPRISKWYRQMCASEGGWEAANA